MIYQAHTPWNIIIATRTGTAQITNRLYPKKDSTNGPHPGPSRRKAEMAAELTVTLPHASTTRPIFITTTR